MKDYTLFLDNKSKINEQLEDKIKMAFGYTVSNDIAKVNKSVNKIFDFLIKIYQTYYSHQKIYNASKHGHRIFHFHNFNGNENEPVVYLDRKPKDYVNKHSKSDEKYLLDYIPISRSIIDEIIIPRKNELKFYMIF